MGNDGTVKIGVEVDEKEFESSLSKLGKSAKMAFTVGVEIDKKEFDSELSKLEKEAKQTDPVEIPVEIDADDFKKELGTITDKLGEGQEATEALDEATDDLGQSYASVGDIIKGVAIGDLISSGVQAAISGIKDLVGEIWNLDDATAEFREAQGKLNTAFEAAGMGPEAAKRAYSDFYKILGDTDTATEASQLLATLANSEEDLSTWTNIAAGVFGTFGDSLPIEGLIEAANETAKTGKVTGVLADALNWAGISEDDFNDGLAALGDESRRNDLIMNTLSNTYSDAADAFYKNNDAVIDARENQIRLDEAMANVGDTISRIKNTFLAELSPAISEIAGKFSDLAASVDWEELASRVGDFVESIDLDSIFGSIENALANVDLDSLFDTIGDLIGGLISFAQTIAPVVSTVAEFGSQLFELFERMNPQVKLFLVGFLGAVVAVGKLGGAISSIGGAVSGVGKIASAFSTGAGDQFYNTFVKWSVIIIAIIGSLTLLIAMINTLMGKGDEMKSTLNSMGGAMNGMSGGRGHEAPRKGQSGDPGPLGGGARQRRGRRRRRGQHHGGNLLPGSRNPGPGECNPKRGEPGGPGNRRNGPGGWVFASAPGPLRRRCGFPPACTAAEPPNH